MTESRKGLPAIIALAVIVVITATWWSLALWPLTSAAPEWLARTRYVCFGAGLEGLPDATGWMILIGQPLGMVALLVFVWKEDVRAGMERLLERTAGQITVGLAAALVVAGVATAGLRVRDANAAPFDPNPQTTLGQQLTRIDDIPPQLQLIDQNKKLVTLHDYEGRAVLLTFAFAHCETVCPLTVHDVLTVRDKLAAGASERTPAVMVVTLDPYRDTPSRLASIADQWGLSGDAHVLSGDPAEVELTLNRWRIPRVRNGKTGDFTHPTLVYVIGPTGRINYVVNGSREQIEAALNAL